MTTPQPDEFSRNWPVAWNAHDIDSVLVHFADDVAFSSPVASRVITGSDGIVRGRAALREYWSAALRLIPDLRFELLGVYAGVGIIVINYRNQCGGLVNEVLTFDEQGQVREGHGTYLTVGTGPGA